MARRRRIGDWTRFGSRDKTTAGAHKNCNSRGRGPKYCLPVPILKASTFAEEAYSKALRRDKMSDVGHTQEFLGLDFHCDTLDAAAKDLVSQDHQVPFRYVVTPNVHDMVRLLENAAQIGPLYADAWRTYCDSRIL